LSRHSNIETLDLIQNEFIPVEPGNAKEDWPWKSS